MHLISEPCHVLPGLQMEGLFWSVTVLGVNTDTNPVPLDRWSG